MMIVVMVGVLLLFRRSNGITVFVIGMTSVRNWFHVALLVGGKQQFKGTELIRPWFVRHWSYVIIEEEPYDHRE
jgi:hypothetical protein